jgi:hypothetical protein
MTQVVRGEVGPAILGPETARSASDCAAPRNEEAGDTIGEDCGHAHRVALVIDDLLDPLDLLIMQGKDLMERLRHEPIRRLVEQGDSAERVRSALTTLAAQLQDVAGAMADRNTVAGDDLGSDLDASSELPALIDAIVRDAIDKAGGSQAVDMRITSLPKGLIWISLEGDETGYLKEFDVWQVFDTTKRELGSLGLSVFGEIVTAHGGRILARRCGPGIREPASTSARIPVDDRRTRARSRRSHR